jgi:hypothetical protein
VDEALALHRQALAIRRERAGRYAGFLFVPWELTRSLNAVAEALMAESPRGLDEARNLFAEARAVGLGALENAPSYTQVRRQVAVAEEGLARVATLQRPAGDAEAAALWRQAAARWREVLASSNSDPMNARDVERVDALAAARTPGR